MTATTIPQSLPSRTWNSLLRLAVGLTAAVVLIAGSFAIGRSTADESVVVRHVVPVSTATNSPSDLPPVSLHAGAAKADVPAVADDASCGHTANTPPC